MKLIWKFNLVLLGIFVLGFLVAGYVSWSALQTNAREEILQHARLMMESAQSSRNYTTTKNKRKTPKKLSLNKYCSRCRKHTEHRETK